MRTSQVMIECLQNHTPDVIIVDEIGRKQEVQAARDVGNRGVTVWAKSSISRMM
jgi:stage III sporulation protein SpoIIIAA